MRFEAVAATLSGLPMRPGTLVLMRFLSTSDAATADQTGWLETLVNWVVSFMETIGAPGAGFAIFAENLFPPIPSEAILPMAGIAAHAGSFTIWEAIFWTTLGSVLGALVLYGVGALVGVPRLVWIAEKVPLMRGSDVTKTVDWFNKHGSKAVFFGRFLPIFRSLISIPAGVTRMPIPKFLLLTGLGSLIWNTAFILVGWFLGAGWHIVTPYMDVVQDIVIIAVLLFIAGFVVLRVRTIRREKREAAEGTAT